MDGGRDGSWQSGAVVPPPALHCLGMNGDSQGPLSHLQCSWNALQKLTRRASCKALLLQKSMRAARTQCYSRTHSVKRA